ncbi:hypothetical protein DFAR_2760012 [Desulfarculales bacterium]
MDPRRNHQLDTQDRRSHGQASRGDRAPAGASPARFQSLPSLVTLAKNHGEARVEAACLRALPYGAFRAPGAESASSTKNWTRHL